MAGKQKSRCHASGVAYEGGRTGGRVQAIPPQSGVTACTYNIAVQTLDALALRMVISCCAMTDKTSMSMRLNSSKQHQAPD